MAEKDEAIARWLDEGPKPGEVYRHYKGGLYTVIATAIREDTLERVVVYSSNARPGVWVRSLENFTGEVEIDGVPTPVGRFQREPD